jgi:methylated-DNA-[protein]-cysteine S-methyltransferase
VRVTRQLYDAPGFGVGEVWSRDGVIVQHELASAAIGRGRHDHGDMVAEKVASDLCGRIVEHLAGVPTSYDDVPIDLDWGTDLQRAFAAAARAIPWGDVVTYGELAVLAGRPGAARAAGSFCADNRYSLVIPCHRVVAANGIGGYGAPGTELKRRLLALEGVTL